MSHNLEWLNKNRIVYKRNPITDIPTETYDWGYYFEDGTYQCYDLFRSRAKITTYKSLKWHLLVLLYLNKDITKSKFIRLAQHLSNKNNEFVTFLVSLNMLNEIIDSIYNLDYRKPPKNKKRKIIFKDFSGLKTNQKLQIVGRFIGRIRKCTEEGIYEAMLLIHEQKEIITIKKIANSLNVTPRTIYRNMTDELKKEKKILNNEKV